MASEAEMSAKYYLSQITPGKWVVAEEIDGVYAGKKTVVRADEAAPYYRSRIVTVGQTRPHIYNPVNIEFIAAAPELVQGLLDEIQRLYALIGMISINRESGGNVGLYQQRPGGFHD
ncbi:hypothetical protein SEA_FORZA_32 [Gordonia phage Forza]|uniref:Uncharacterized protein n=1 Tax=Gordonia phage Forza TaxID=2571247 RepID=A0A650EZC3_9CAUD|nr:hypothetical protein PP303_gp032 [Gordonia phage Forza]QEM41502.1 hypothetical protein SEA_BOOPY_33 [Gordonia phage Boopy]QGT55025.1 hypothetical protein SEA_FORZA_32 [Gordonia phage Forza]UXE04175.1 hypothetical protein SEA_BLUENGOLD_31 [Gordonia phage BlueNGold]WBF03814.1 hypothetical protein SEA_MAREELIH_31 [Gordonia phage Mareelih]